MKTVPFTDNKGNITRFSSEMTICDFIEKGYRISVEKAGSPLPDGALKSEAEEPVPHACCGYEPTLKPAGLRDYPGTVRYECRACGKTTLGCFSTVGLSSDMALEQWNKLFK